MNTASPALLNSREIAAIYGVSSATIMRWLDAGEIPAAVRVRQVIRFDPAKVAAALAKRSAISHQPKPRGPLMVPVI